MRPLKSRWLVVGLLLLAATSVARTVSVVASQAPSSPPPEAPILAQGWAALAKGDLARASTAATQAMAGYPGSPATLALAVEVDLTRGGRLAGLDTYERWLRDRRVDEPHVLRRIALAFLRSTVDQNKDPRARLEALKALVAEGDPVAQKLLNDGASAGSFAETRVLASMGDARAVNQLIAQLRSPTGNKLLAISALSESGSRLAIAPLVETLADPRPEVRATAVDGLGRLGARDAIDRIVPLLDDPSLDVRCAAAGALYRLEDMRGVPLLQQMLASEHANLRLSAVDRMASHPDAQWRSAARDLTRDPDAAVRVMAARLIAPYEPDVAAATLDRLLEDGNLAIREEAGRVMSERVARDFAGLRRLLRHADNLVAVRAAARILDLTR